MEKIQYHIRMAVNPHFQLTGIGKDIEHEAGKNGLVIQIDEVLDEWRDEFKGMDAPHNYRSIITAEIAAPYIDHIKKSVIKDDIFPGILTKWLKYFDSIFQKEGKTIEEFLEKALRLYPLTVYFFATHGKLCFTFPVSGGSKVITEAWQQMVELLTKYSNKDSETLKWLDTVPRQKNNMSFLIFEPGTDSWELIDRLIDASARLSASYLESIKDNRIRKPYIVFNEDNYNQYDYFDNQWSLQIDKETIIMPQPNDIALYVRLADKAIAAAEPYYNEEYKRRSGQLHMPLLYTEDYLKYYDYFEDIMAAIIFSYTSIETLANICIPDDFEYTEEGKGKDTGIKKIYNKEAIERNLPLRDKLKIVLKEVLKTPDVTIEKWWNDFIALEQIRNEIIHTKQSKSEERYSLFLAKHIFRIIGCNKAIIKFYGQFIQKEYPRLLFDFPYGFGYDTVPASFMSNKDYVAHYNALHNPFVPWKGDPPID